jgi:hypothetical protein
MQCIYFCIGGGVPRAHARAVDDADGAQLVGKPIHGRRDRLARGEPRCDQQAWLHVETRFRIEHRLQAGAHAARRDATDDAGRERVGVFRLRHAGRDDDSGGAGVDGIDGAGDGAVLAEGLRGLARVGDLHRHIGLHEIRTGGVGVYQVDDGRRGHGNWPWTAIDDRGGDAVEE